MAEIDQSLIAQAKQGDERAFGQIYEQYFEKIYRFIYFRVNHKEIAEDLAEEVFIKAWTKIDHVSSESFNGWLYQIAKNSIIDHYRQRKATMVDLEEVSHILESEHDVSEQTNMVMDRKLFIKLLEQLPQEHQTVIRLKFLEELDNDEIAAVMNKKEGAIRVIQHRAIQRLQQLLANNIPKV